LVEFTFGSWRVAQRGERSAAQLSIRSLEATLLSRHRRARWCGVTASVTVPPTRLSHRTFDTLGFGSTELCAQIEHRLIELGHVIARQHFVRQGSSFGSAERAISQCASEYSSHVGIEYGNSLTKREGGYGVGGVLANPRQ
jgi:hypothetical protein